MWIFEDEDEDEVLDDQESEQSNVDDSETEEAPAAKKGETVRESLRRALKQQDAEEDGEKSDTSEKKSSKKSVVASNDEELEENEDETDTGETKNQQKETKSKVVSKQNTDAPPPGWTKQAKAHWNNLPQEIKESVLKRENEVSDGFKQYGEKVKDFETRQKDYAEIDGAFTGREAELTRLGVSKSQVVKQMFQWIDALSHSDKNYAKAQLIQLGKNYGIDLTPQAPTQSENKQGQTPETTELPPELKSLADNINGRFKTIEDNFTQAEQQRQQREQQERQQAAQKFVENWAKDKPHYSTVRQAMFGLLQSGSIPLKNGELDLDEAYNQAVYANPVTRELLRIELAEKEAAEAEAKRKDKELKQLRQVNKAKTAGNSLSTKAPTGTVLKPGQRKDGKPPSVRDSLKQSIGELREQN